MSGGHFTHFSEVQSYIFEQLPMFQRQGPRALKYDLSNISRLMAALGDPQLSFKSIHIAGTNGKGSTAHLISAIFQNSGYKTGLYTSPHYKDFRERVKLNGVMIDKPFIVDFFNSNYKLITRLKPSYFEISVALAFSYFERKNVDIAIVEVGLGGRLDSTNIIRPLLSIITNISRDHIQTLGNKLESIAGEKAGIIKEGVPVLIGDEHPRTRPIFEKTAQQYHAPIFFSDELISNDQMESELFNQIHGPFAVRNVKYALASIALINNYYPFYQLAHENIIRGISKVKTLTKYIGRWEILGESPKIIADGAHNSGGIEETVKHLLNLNYSKLHMVMGFVFDKNLEPLLALLPKEATYYFCKAAIPRGIHAKALKDLAEQHGLKGLAYRTVRLALEAARSSASPDDLIFLGGSIYVVGEII